MYHKAETHWHFTISLPGYLSDTHEVYPDRDSVVDEIRSCITGWLENDYWLYEPEERIIPCISRDYSPDHITIEYDNDPGNPFHLPLIIEAWKCYEDNCEENDDDAL